MSATEELPLLGVSSAASKDKDIDTVLNFSIVFSYLCLFGIAAILVVGKDFLNTPSSGNINMRSHASLSWTLNRKHYDPLPFFVSNDLDLKYDFLEEFDAVIEPNVKTQLYHVGGDLSSFSVLNFTVCSESSNNCMTGDYTIKMETSSSIELKCTSFETFVVAVTYSESQSSTFKAICMYVRREIRDLNPSDLEAAINAMATMWYTTEEQGQKVYGENFHNSSYFTLAHYYGASHREADHIHEGLGFLPQHVKISNLFELSMQAIDPAVTLPYWDFTKDGVLQDFYMFQPETFGTLTFPKETQWTYRSNAVDDGRIKDGLWANLTVESAMYYHNHEVEPNPYGTLRGPWNFNPSIYVTRFPLVNLSDPLYAGMTLPTCASYVSWMSLTTLQSFLNIADASPHTGTHDSIGGVYGCDNFDFMVERGWVENTDMICFKWGTLMKDLWRTHSIYVDASCTAELGQAIPTCGFKCDESYADAMLLEIKLKTRTILNYTIMDSNDWADLTDFICMGNGTLTFFGDNRESASCSDPSFWPIHPTLDRALQAKLLAGGFESMHWPNTTDSDANTLCFRHTCFVDDVEGDFYECCIGHYEDDAFPDWVQGNLTPGVGLTNKQYLEQTDATSANYAMPYIYDGFSWSHCGDDVENDVDTLLQEMYYNATQD